MKPNICTAIGAASAATAVIAGAFGAHGLESVEPGTYHADAVELFKTAAHYQMVHALALVAAGALPCLGDVARAAAGGLFLGGSVLFSGSLYALALSDVSLLGAITPVGGLAFIAGWVVMAVAAARGGPRTQG